MKHQQASAPTQPAEVKPLSPARFKVAFTASAELCDKLERLQALMRASGDSADLASVIDAAVTEKLEKLEAKRYGTEVMNRFRSSPSRVSESAAVYTFSNRATLAS